MLCPKVIIEFFCLLSFVFVLESKVIIEFSCLLSFVLVLESKVIIEFFCLLSFVLVLESFLLIAIYPGSFKAFIGLAQIFHILNCLFTI